MIFVFLKLNEDQWHLGFIATPIKTWIVSQDREVTRIQNMNVWGNGETGIILGLMKYNIDKNEPLSLLISYDV